MYLSNYTDRDNPGGNTTKETGKNSMASTRRMKYDDQIGDIGGNSTQSASREDGVVLVDLSGQDQAKHCRKCTGKRVHDRRAAHRNRHFTKGNHDDEEARVTVWITTKEKVQSERRDVKFDNRKESIEEDKEDTENERQSHNCRNSTGYQISNTMMTSNQDVTDLASDSSATRTIRSTRSGNSVFRKYRLRRKAFIISTAETAQDIKHEDDKQPGSHGLSKEKI